MNRIAGILNPFLTIFGRKIIESRMGHWSVNPLTNRLQRKTYPTGWRLARREEYEGLAENATEFDRFAAKHKKEIEARRTAVQ